jgi:hypothetical protein
MRKRQRQQQQADDGSSESPVIETFPGYGH